MTFVILVCPSLLRRCRHLFRTASNTTDFDISRTIRDISGVEVLCAFNRSSLKSLSALFLHTCHNHALSGGYLAFYTTFGKLRSRHWWATLSLEIQSYTRDLQACLRKKTAYQRAMLTVGSFPLTLLEVGPTRS